MYEGCGIHTHEGYESPEVERLRADFISAAAQAGGVELQRSRTEQREHANCNDVVARHAALGFDDTKEGTG
jgi:hypothetical protein